MSLTLVSLDSNYAAWSARTLWDLRRRNHAGRAAPGEARPRVDGILWLTRQNPFEPHNRPP